MGVGLVAAVQFSKAVHRMTRDRWTLRDALTTLRSQLHQNRNGSSCPVSDAGTARSVPEPLLVGQDTLVACPCTLHLMLLLWLMI